MKKVLIQIYEIQTPEEASSMAALGVDHIGSVLLNHQDWKSSVIKDTVNTVHEHGAKSSLIPLFNDPYTIFKALDYYCPDMIHFCEMLVEPKNMQHYDLNSGMVNHLTDLQRTIKDKFPKIKIIRSIPIPPAGFTNRVPSMKVAELFEPLSDFFLTDTFMIHGQNTESQPVEGFIGITGKTCDWDTASKLVKRSKIPVILAGGISPENAYDGILKVGPAGIDSCTLTNAQNNLGKIVRFKKDPEKVKSLVMAVRNAEKHLKN